MRRSASLRPLTFIALSALALPIFAVQGQEATSRASIQAIPKAERPMLAVRDIEFQAQLSSDERRELNQWTALATIFGGRRDATMDARTTIDLLAKQTTTLLQEAVQATGNFRLLERNQMDAALSEQDLGNSDRAKAGQGRAEMGEVLVARYVVTGAITKFGQAKQKKSIGGAVLGGIIGGIAGTKVENRQQLLDIGLTVKIVEASTNELIESFTVDGEALGDKSRRIAGLGGTWGSLAGGAYESSTTGERERLIAQALRNAVEQAAVRMVSVRERGDLLAK